MASSNDKVPPTPRPLAADPPGNPAGALGPTKVPPPPPPDDQVKVSPNVTAVAPANPAQATPTLDARGGPKPTVKAVAAPIIPGGPEVAVVQPPVVLANAPELDPSNPAGAPRQDNNRPRDKQILAYRDELHQLLMRDATSETPEERQAADDRLHELHYLVNGQDVPTR